VQDLGHRFVVDADAQRSAVIHGKHFSLNVMARVLAVPRAFRLSPWRTAANISLARGPVRL
jgi:hypothetical protein